MKFNSLMENLIEPLTKSLEEWINSAEARKVVRVCRHPQIEKYVNAYGNSPDTPGEAAETRMKHLRAMAAGRRFEDVVLHGLSRFLLNREECNGFIGHGGKTILIFPLERGNMGEVFFQDASVKERRLGDERAEFDGLLLLKSGEIVLIEICNSKNGDLCGGIKTLRKMALLKESWPSHVFPHVLIVIPAESKASPWIPNCRVIRLHRSDKLVEELESGAECEGSPRKIKEKNPDALSRFEPIYFGQCTASIASDFLQVISGDLEPNAFTHNHVKDLYLLKRIYLGCLPSDVNMMLFVEAMLPESKREKAREILSYGHIEEIHLTIHSEEPGKCLQPVLHCFHKDGKGESPIEHRASLTGISKVSTRKSKIFFQAIPATPVRLTGEQVMSAIDIYRQCILPPFSDF